MTINGVRVQGHIVGLLLAMLLVVLTVCATGWWSARRVAETWRWVDHTHRVLYELEAVLAQAVSVQSGARGFALTGEERYLEPYRNGMMGLQQTLPRLTQLVADSPRQQARVARLHALIDEELAVMKERLAARQKGGLAAAGAATADGRGKNVLDAIRGHIRGMQDEERRLLEERSHAAQRAGRSALSVLTVGGGLIVVLALAAIVRARNLVPAGSS